MCLAFACLSFEAEGGEKKAKFSPKLPDGYQLVALLVDEESPSGTSEKVWFPFAEKFANRYKAKWMIESAGQKATLVLGDFSWQPTIPKDVPKVRILVPDFRAGRLKVMLNGKEVWSVEKDGFGVLSSEIEIDHKAEKPPMLEIKVASPKDSVLVKGVSNIIIIAPKVAEKK
jgi:hypothetical protein